MMRAHPQIFLAFPRWYAELRERTTREERRRIAYMWLCLPRSDAPAPQRQRPSFPGLGGSGDPGDSHADGRRSGGERSSTANYYRPICTGATDNPYVAPAYENNCVIEVRSLLNGRSPRTLISLDAYDLWAANYPPQAHNTLMQTEQQAMLDLHAVAGGAGRA